ncbi:uncharacterized protein NP_5098A [Natronomonas pharaonis DSM 2160]|uniref:DUF8080 domain-containing protein n=1 Tax=Natronomonas pharaonis (strain ATCC 35678 / DSM 2160 / CIP 103997 / JCM 8858 / NBRC 14720 / NCIMB 2260 / Gabara) TaxID=348780 RepID=A0A1U7EZB7_NATPD|nr:hypothetical protein [Natronomonas pharaonis]CAI50640.1 uncharacterized protein NP_5098A [Natronomonas pharaonis DSM 2160]
MPSIDAETRHIDGVTFVEGVVRADAPRRVQLVARCDGPVWPPRREGIPTENWDGDRVTVEAGPAPVGIGFATPGDVSTEPVAIVASEPVADELPTGVAAWVQNVESRLEAGERLAAAESLDEAANAVAAVGGLSAAEQLTDALARDRRLASQLSIVPPAVSERLETVDIPVEAFRTLAQSRRS